MTHPTILVTGATGKTGGAVARQLLRQGWPVRALVHREDERSRALRQAGADVVVADLFDAQQMRDALQGVHRAYYVTLFRPGLARAAQAFADAVRASRLEAIVQLSQWLSHPTHPSIQTRETWQADQIFAGLRGPDHVVVNPGMFADNFLRLIHYASLLHVYPVLTGDSESAPVAHEDIARVVVALLADPRRHAGRRWRPTGPHLLTGRQMARTIATVLGQPVVPVDLPMWMFRKAARMDGADIHEVSNYAYYLQEHRRGSFALGGGVTDVVERLTGTPAEPFDVTAARYAALPSARPTLRNRMWALARFAVLPLYPGHDLGDYERRLGLAPAADATLAIDSEPWRTRHLAQMAEQGIGGAGGSAPPRQPSAPGRFAPVGS